MRFQPIIVPGWRNSGPDHWQSLWERTLPHAVRVPQRDWENPDPQSWIGTLAACVEAAPWPALLIAHSLGCIAAAALPAALHGRIAAALLVAPADVERPGAPACLGAFAPIATRSLPFQSVVVASDNDPYCSLARARHLAEQWGSRLIVLPGAGHINAEAGFGAWPQGLNALRALRRRAAWRVRPPSRRIPPMAQPAQG
ncbi:RBBP9/YdeN family alpha/beta hydrolase [Bordetella genomosp. 9]|uniref:Alpha/beta hydrolase n=1 Tax=Bordetella genomosp. 9 TaxID=1416803 RepID=A0A1W6Z5M2_9BORD|nr:alpha/beta hydrolase [Bordetella genomosp. 9]ARP88648.1 alpha/beta hydrolase [Bordetella genomosp. 9]ARP92623.1 alpha/beta hydrolase [Bordetella genomosp. 9]